MLQSQIASNGRFWLWRIGLGEQVGDRAALGVVCLRFLALDTNLFDQVHSLRGNGRVFSRLARVRDQDGLPFMDKSGLFAVSLDR